MEGLQDLGQRIVQAARMAVAVHLYESVARHTDPQGDALRVARQILRRRVVTGGAGPHVARDGGGGQPASARLGDLVTDDERDGLMGLDALDALDGRRDDDHGDDAEQDLTGTGRDGAD